MNGSSTHEGRVEVKHNGEWGTICDDVWDIDDANVVCKSMGYLSAINSTTNAYFPKSTETRTIMLDDLQCTGGETNLAYCPHNGYKKHNCDPDHSEDAGVICDEGIM